MHAHYEICGKCKWLIPAPATTAPWVAAYDEAHPEPIPELFSFPE